MVDFNASTPQLKLVKKLADAYVSLETSNIEPLLSKNYQYEAPPDFPKMMKESHLQMLEGVFSSLNKYEVRIRYRRTVFKLGLISTILRPLITKRLKHRGKLISTFVPPYTTATLSRTITLNHDAGHARVLYRLRGHVQLRYYLHLRFCRGGWGTQDPPLQRLW